MNNESNPTKEEVYCFTTEQLQAYDKWHINYDDFKIMKLLLICLSNQIF